MSEHAPVYAVRLLQADYAQATAFLQAQAVRETDDDSRAVLQKRVDVLKRRSDHVAGLEKTLTNVSYQLQLLEDTFGLINGEVRARSPEQVLSDIDDVTAQTDAMTRTLEEIAPYIQQGTSG